MGTLGVLIVSGTIDIDTANDDETLTSALRSLAASPPPLTSVCTGAVLLARAGLLAEAHQATTDHEDIDLLADVIGDRATIARWVDSGSIVTAGGALQRHRHYGRLIGRQHAD